MQHEPKAPDGHLSNIPERATVADVAPAQATTHARLRTAGRHSDARPTTRPRVLALTPPQTRPVASSTLPTLPTSNGNRRARHSPESLHPGRRSDSAHAAWAEHVFPRVHAGTVPETGFSAYDSRARATPAIRQRPVHMAWDLETYQLTPWRRIGSIVLLLFLQKQNLATSIYLFGLGTLLT